MRTKIHMLLLSEGSEEEQRVPESQRPLRSTEERAADPAKLNLSRQDIARFWDYVNATDCDSCWLWNGSVTPQGYGRFMVNGKRLPAHRIAAFLIMGTFPGPTLVLHKCDNRPCCNPKHLFLGTSDENMADMVSKGRSAHGEKNKGAVLSSKDVLMIRSIWSLPKHPPSSVLAIQFKVSETAILRIVNNKTWKRI